MASRKPTAVRRRAKPRIREILLLGWVRREAMPGTLHELTTYIKHGDRRRPGSVFPCYRRVSSGDPHNVAPLARDRPIANDFEVSMCSWQRRNGVTQDRPHVIKGKVTSATIVRRVDLTPEHFKIWLRTAEPFPFEPGQYCTVGVASVERPYSIVSSPREPLLELFVELIPPPRGHLTPLLHALNVGDTVTLRPRAKGVFLLRPEFRNHVMVATVTGIAPFVSMLRYWLEGPADDSRMYVLEGASFRDEFGYDDELTALAQRNAS